MSVTGKVGKWIYNFLNERTQRVVVRGAESEQIIVTSSVPQGTVLAPSIFDHDCRYKQKCGGLQGLFLRR